MNTDAIRTALQAAGLSTEAIDAAVAAAEATHTRNTAAAELQAAQEALNAARARALAAGIIAPTPAARPHVKRVTGGRECACGCQGWTRGGTWLPGHDAKNGGHKARIASQVQ